MSKQPFTEFVPLFTCSLYILYHRNRRTPSISCKTYANGVYYIGKNTDTHPSPRPGFESATSRILSRYYTHYTDTIDVSIMIMLPLSKNSNRPCRKGESEQKTISIFIDGINKEIQ